MSESFSMPATGSENGSFRFLSDKKEEQTTSPSCSLSVSEVSYTVR
jgi:hypothetical protein